MATFKLKRLPQPTLRMKALPRFPASMQGGDGVAVTQSGGVFTFSLDPGFTPSFTDALPFAAGDIFYASGAASATRLAAAAAGQALLSGATPAWGKVGLTTHVAGVLPAANGGTGIANTGTITLGGALVTAGALTTSGPFPLMLTATGATNVTLPASGTLATLAGSETLSNKDLASPTISGTATITAAATASGLWTFSNTPTSLSTAAGAAAGPFYSSYRNSTGAADNLIGGYQHFGNNSTPTFFQYARSQARIKDATAGSEDGEWSAWTAVAGTLAERFTVGQGARIGAPSGGDPGSGGLNVAGSLLVNNVAVPTISSASALTNKTYNGLTVTSSTGTLTIASAKTATVSNTLTFSGTDGSSVAFGAGGTVAYVGASARIRLTADTDFYVAPSPTGNDTTGTGLTVGSPWATIQHAMDVIAQTYDLAGYRATINVADGTYSGSGSTGWIVRQIGPFTGAAPRGTTFPGNTVIPVLIKGNTSTPGNVILTCSGSDTILADAGAYFGIEGCRINNTFGSGSALRTGTCASILYGNIVFGACGDARRYAGHFSVIEEYSSCWLTGNSTYVDKAAYGGTVFRTGTTETLLSNVSVTAYAYVRDTGSLISSEAMTFTPGAFSVTGKKFDIDNGGAIRTASSGDLSYFPGSTAGTMGFGSYDGKADNLTLYTGLTVKLVDAGAASGPVFSAFRDSASPAASDQIGLYAYFARNSSAGIPQYIGLKGYILDPTAGSEDALWSVQTIVAGALTDRFFVGQGAYMSGATGFDKGPGTFNAQALYVNGVKPILAVRTQKKTTTGAGQTYTPDTNLVYAIIECWGGGGGGGGVQGAASWILGGAGGGAGSYTRSVKTLAQIQADSTFTSGHIDVSVGTGGNGGAAGANNGSAGGDTSVGNSLVVAKGGSGGGFNSTGQNGTGGSGGVAGTGDLTGVGASGRAGWYVTGATVGGESGFGANTSLGGGAPGVTAAGAGNNGTANTGGGGSGAWRISAADSAGGNGGSGVIFITEFCSA